MPILQRTVQLGSRSYPILIGPGLIEGHPLLSELIDHRQVAIITNHTIAPQYLHQLEKGLSNAKIREIISLPDGEVHKNWDSIDKIISTLLRKNFDRHCLLIALGGGVIGDLTGFAASIYQRGVSFIQVPTTLLAQVDSSVGGKTAINHRLGKNMVGAFHQPKLVLSDINTLKTLPQREYAAGLAEIIKHGAIADPVYFSQIETHVEALATGKAKPEIISQIIARSCEIKSSIVAKDERESGMRALLNFGHTFGHAIELGLGYGVWLHGEAVGAGMVIAAELSRQLGLLSDHDATSLTKIIKAAGLPTFAPQWPFEKYLELLHRDKKTEHGELRFVLLKKLGESTLQRVSDDKLKSVIAMRSKA